MNRFVRVVVIAVAIALGSPAVAAASGGLPAWWAAARTPDPGLIDPYASHFGVNRDVASARIALQAKAGDIVGALQGELGERYAGVWFDNESGRFKVAVVVGEQFAADAGAVRELVAKLEIADHVDLVAAEHTRRELERLQHEVDRALAEQIGAQKVVTMIDDVHNRVSVAVPEGQPRPSVMAQFDDEPVAVRQAPEGQFKPVPQACAFPNCDRPLRGGVLIAGPAFLCTAGYIGYVPGSPGARRLITAGHCTYVSGSWAATHATTATGYWIGASTGSNYGANGDSGKIAIEASSFWFGPPAVLGQVAAWGQTDTYPINGTMDPYVGLFQCHLGASSYGQCGTVTWLNTTITYAALPPLPATTVYGLALTDACGLSGDSGGPWPANYLATGIHSGGGSFCGSGQYSLYDPIRRAESVLGVNVLPY